MIRGKGDLGSLTFILQSAETELQEEVVIIKEWNIYN